MKAKKARTKLFQIDLGHAMAGILVLNGVVIDAAPILKRLIGKKEPAIRNYIKKKKWKITKVTH